MVNHIYVNGLRIAAWAPDGGDFSLRYYLEDQVDSVKVVLDKVGDTVARTEYYPYGEEWVHQDGQGQSEPAAMPKFNSQELDKETGYYFYNARHYDPQIARFVTADTVVDGAERISGWNRYAYVHGNPIRYKDPTGHTGESRYAPFLEKYQSGEYATDTVQLHDGGTVHGVAQKIGVDTKLLLEMNDIKDPTKLQIGHELRIPRDLRPLTNNEIAEEKKVFGESIDYDEVIIAKDTFISHLGSESTKVVGYTVHLNPNHSPKGTLKFDSKHLLIHELTHVRQYQKDGWGYAADAVYKHSKYEMAGDYPYDYSDKLSAGAAWDRWGAEEQAEAVADYYRAKYEPIYQNPQMVDDLAPYVEPLKE